MVATIVGDDIDWFGDDTNRIYVRFQINREDDAAKQRPASDKLLMLRNAYANNKPSLLYPNAVVVTEGAYIAIEVVVRGNEGDVGCGFSIMTGSSRGSRDAVDRPIAEKLSAVGPASIGPDGRRLWWNDRVRRFQGAPNLISVDSLGSLVSGNRTTANIAELMPRSQLDIYAWPVRMYNDLDFGESYYKDYPPPGEGPPIFAEGKPKQVKDIGFRESLPPPPSASAERVVLGAITPTGMSKQSFSRIEVQEEQVSKILGSLNIQLFVLKALA